MYAVFGVCYCTIPMALWNSPGLVLAGKPADQLIFVEQTPARSVVDKLTRVKIIYSYLDPRHARSTFYLLKILCYIRTKNGGFHERQQPLEVPIPKQQQHKNHKNS